MSARAAPSSLSRRKTLHAADSRGFAIPIETANHERGCRSGTVSAESAPGGQSSEGAPRKLNKRRGLVLEIAEVREDVVQVGLRQAEPLRQRAAVLVGGGAGEPGAAAAGIVGAGKREGEEGAVQ